MYSEAPMQRRGRELPLGRVMEENNVSRIPTGLTKGECFMCVCVGGGGRNLCLRRCYLIPRCQGGNPKRPLLWAGISLPITIKGAGKEKKSLSKAPPPMSNLRKSLMDSKEEWAIWNPYSPDVQSKTSVRRLGLRNRLLV